MGIAWIGDQLALDRAVVGGKAYSLNLMRGLGLPVPPAFVLGTDECMRYQAGDGDTLAAETIELLSAAMRELETRSGKDFGSPERPLLVSVRSGAPTSMPGMMDTILNLGINDDVEAGLAAFTGDPVYAADTHRRFREQFEVVVGVAAPADPWKQLQLAVAAVFGSWGSARALAYRKHHGVSDDGGTSVTVQAMVFGNLDDHSGTGVVFSRNPTTGDPGSFGEWLPRGQGEDIVSGRHDPLPLDDLNERLPEVHAALLDAARVLEVTGKDVQDIEFTVESGGLWLLQSRPAKRSPDAAVRFAVALCDDGIISEEEALDLVTPEQVAAVCRPRVAPDARISAQLLAQGLPACPGVGSGLVTVDVDEAEARTDEGEEVVLARPTTDPNDVRGMIVASAIVTEVGGATSHAALVSRELGTPCVVGCGSGSLSALAGRTVTVDGSNGEVFDGVLKQAPIAESENPALATLAGWARTRLGEPNLTAEQAISAVHESRKSRISAV